MKHMGMRKVLTGAMALMLALSVAGAALAGSYPSPAFRLPGVKERPAATEAPAEVETPEETEAPEETAAPETDTPDVTETPEEAPEATEAPEDAAAPEPTADPEVSLEPTEAPEETAAPAVDTGSEVTVLPEASPEPAAPEATAAPEETAVPDEEPAAEIGYTYERDENGALVLDESGNPVVHVPEGWDIPVKFLRDEEGNLVLDENGNPVIEQTVPAGSQIIGKEENVLNPNRTITTYLATAGSIYFGDPVTFVTVLDGYEGVTYTLQWQQSDNGTWYDLPGENGSSLTITATEENCTSTWRVCVNISD